MQDTASNAMTEVALGLSMAFFSLLVVALLSFGMPQPVSAVNALAEQTKVTLQSSQMNNASDQILSDTDNNAEQVWIFYFQGSFYNQKLVKLSQPLHKPNANVVLVVPPSLAFNHVINIYKQIPQEKKKITQMNEEWLIRFQQLLVKKRNINTDIPTGET